MQLREIAYDVDGHVLTITLDRPARLNAFTPRMRDELLAAFDRADADDDVRAVIVTGRGQAFCAGADLSGGAATFDPATRQAPTDGEVPGVPRDGGGRVALRIYDSLKPVIAAINGAAVGIGITMTLPMDIRIAAGDAKLGFVFTRRGLVPEAAAAWFLPRLVGMGQALEWTLTGRIFRAAEAENSGLLHRVVPADQVLPVARALAEEIVENTAPVSVALTRQMLWRLAGASHPMQAHRIDSQALSARGVSPDVAEGVAAFTERRPPNFPVRVSDGLPPFYPWWTEPSYDD